MSAPPEPDFGASRRELLALYVRLAHKIEERQAVEVVKAFKQKGFIVASFNAHDRYQDGVFLQFDRIEDCAAARAAMDGEVVLGGPIRIGFNRNQWMKFDAVKRKSRGRPTAELEVQTRGCFPQGTARGEAERELREEFLRYGRVARVEAGDGLASAAVAMESPEEATVARHLGDGRRLRDGKIVVRFRGEEMGAQPGGEGRGLSAARRDETAAAEARASGSGPSSPALAVPPAVPSASAPPPQPAPPLPPRPPRNADPRVRAAGRALLLQRRLSGARGAGWAEATAEGDVGAALTRLARSRGVLVDWSRFPPGQPPPTEAELAAALRARLGADRAITKVRFLAGRPAAAVQFARSDDAAEAQQVGAGLLLCGRPAAVLPCDDEAAAALAAPGPEDLVVKWPPKSAARISVPFLERVFGLLACGLCRASSAAPPPHAHAAVERVSMEVRGASGRRVEDAARVTFGEAGARARVLEAAEPRDENGNCLLFAEDIDFLLLPSLSFDAAPRAPGTITPPPAHPDAAPAPLPDSPARPAPGLRRTAPGSQSASQTQPAARLWRPRAAVLAGARPVGAARHGVQAGVHPGALAAAALPAAPGRAARREAPSAPAPFGGRCPNGPSRAAPPAPAPAPAPTPTPTSSSAPAPASSSAPGPSGRPPSAPVAGAVGEGAGQEALRALQVKYEEALEAAADRHRLALEADEAREAARRLQRDADELRASNERLTRTAESLRESVARHERRNRELQETVERLEQQLRARR
eukprot:tig00000093_g3476.t1